MVLPQHIYTLNRGVTTVLLRQIQFSPDSRWVAVVRWLGLDTVAVTVL